MSIEDITKIGRTNEVKASLENSIKTALANVTSDNIVVADAWRIGAYNFSTFTDTLVTIRIMPSRETPLNYGAKITNGYNGTYYIYSVTLRIIDSNADDELEALSVYTCAKALTKYFRKYEGDPSAGILGVFDVDCRDTGINAATSGVIINMKLLVERPLWTDE